MVDPPLCVYPGPGIAHNSRKVTRVIGTAKKLAVLVDLSGHATGKACSTLKRSILRRLPGPDQNGPKTIGFD